MATGIYWSYSGITCTPAVGGVMDIRLRVTAGTDAVDKGIELILRDGTNQYRAWVRPSGANIMGQANVLCDNQAYAVFRLKCRAGQCELFKDGRLLQRAAGAASAIAASIMFGPNGADPDPVVADVDYVRYAPRTWE